MPVKFKVIERGQPGVAGGGEKEVYKINDNPIIKPGSGWDASAVYKPYAVYDRRLESWLLYYNGRNGGHEQIGIAIHKGKDLGF